MSDDIYRFHDGQIQTQRYDGSWMRSAHDYARADELPDYEGHPALPVLRQKFPAQSATP